MATFNILALSDTVRDDMSRTNSHIVCQRVESREVIGILDAPQEVLF